MRPTRADPAARTRLPDGSRPSALHVVVGLLSPLTVLTAMLLALGRVAAAGYFGAFGVHFDAVGMSTLNLLSMAELLLRQALRPILVAVLLAAAVHLLAHRATTPRRQVLVRRVALGLGGVAVVLVVAAFVHQPTESLDWWSAGVDAAPAHLSGLAAAWTTAGYLALCGVWLHHAAGGSRSGGHTAATAVLLVVGLISLYSWGQAAATGMGARWARESAAAPERGAIILHSTRPLPVDPTRHHGVCVRRTPGGDGEFTHHYQGLSSFYSTTERLFAVSRAAPGERLPTALLVLKVDDSLVVEYVAPQHVLKQGAPCPNGSAQAP